MSFILYYLNLVHNKLIGLYFKTISGLCVPVHCTGVFYFDLFVSNSIRGSVLRMRVCACEWVCVCACVPLCLLLRRGEKCLAIAVFIFQWLSLFAIQNVTLYIGYKWLYVWRGKMGFGLVVLTTAVEMMYASCVGVNQIQLCTMSVRGHEGTEDEWGAFRWSFVTFIRGSNARRKNKRLHLVIVLHPTAARWETASSACHGVGRDLVSSRLAVPPSPCAPAASLALLVFFCFLTVN